MLCRVGLPATESVESEGLCLLKVCQWCDLAQGSRLQVWYLLCGDAAAPVTAAASFAARTMAAACGLCGD